MKTPSALTFLLVLSFANPCFPAGPSGTSGSPQLEGLDSGSIPPAASPLPAAQKAAALKSFKAKGGAGIKDLSLREIAARTVAFVLNEQKTEDQGRIYIRGEWPTQIESTLIPIVAGVGKPIGKDEEASAFTTAVVASNLARVYLDNEELKGEYPFAGIPRAIENGIATYERYREGATYNFFPAEIVNGVKVRKSADLTIKKIYHGFMNIPNDSDTTAAVLTSLAYNSRINNGPSRVAQEALDEMSRFLDKDRKPLYYNRMNGVKNTGAFLTWLIDEKDPAVPKKYFARPEDGPRIPFNVNDVDCIVNANILTLLSLIGQQGQPGRNEACSMLNTMIRKDQHATCGVYYPNTLNLSYSLSLAEKAGLQCITEDSNSRMIEKILAIQTAEGGWVNVDNIWQDPVITTGFALYALLTLPQKTGGAPDRRIDASLMYGMHYLLRNAIQKDRYVYWKPDNFFTAVAAARSMIMWSSKAYTNSIIAAVLLEMDKRYPGYTAENYLDLKFAKR